MSNKFSVRVRTADGKSREWQVLHRALGGQSFLRVYPQSGEPEFILKVDSPRQLDDLRAKLDAAGVEEMVGGDTSTILAPPKSTSRPGRQQGLPQRGTQREHQRGSLPQQRRDASTSANASPLPGKPYSFVALPTELIGTPPVWHDGTSSAGRHSGEVRLELDTLTPLLVGWERGRVGDADTDWPVPANFEGTALPSNKSMLCPLRAPWGKRPVVIPGDSLKGLLRHELGALLGAPMERVAERSYSYRPNLKYPDGAEARFLEPRLARVGRSATINIDGRKWPVPEQVDVLSMATRDQHSYFPRNERRSGNFVQSTPEAEPYRGGLGAGERLPEGIVGGKVVHTHIDVRQLRVEHASVRPSPAVMNQYAATLTNLLDVNEGHFSARHPSIGGDQQKQRLAKEAIEKGANQAFQTGDVIWVEWDTEKKRIVSFGWHYYYRWAYTDSVRLKGGKLERHGLLPLDGERLKDDDGAPKVLSPVRRLFGYTGDNAGSKDIGDRDHVQLMGRVSVNAALEVVGDGDTESERFLPPTSLKELGMPRPSAVEHYLQQQHHPRARPSDNATLVTYGDASGYDEPGELAGRKFYLDRKDAYPPYGTDRKPPWEDAVGPENRAIDRSTLAMQASKPQRKFRFTVRFRDLDSTELAAVLIALCPHQFRTVVGGTHPDGYCSKLGYARPLGWGSVRIEAKALLFQDAAGPTLKPEADIGTWVKTHYRHGLAQGAWLAVHRHKHPDAADYPIDGDSSGSKSTYMFHTRLRAEHSRNRRYRNGGAR